MQLIADSVVARDIATRPYLAQCSTSRPIVVVVVDAIYAKYLGLKPDLRAMGEA